MVDLEDVPCGERRDSSTWHTCRLWYILSNSRVSNYDSDGILHVRNEEWTPRSAFLCGYCSDEKYCTCLLHRLATLRDP